MERNTTEKDLEIYIEIFISTLQSTAEKYLSEDLRKKLLHLNVLPAKIIGYISTQFGLAIEYEPATTTKIEIRRGSSRIENLLLQIPHKFLNLEPSWLIYDNGEVNTEYCKFSGVFPFRLMGENTRIFLYNTFFEIDKWNRIIYYAEVFGNRKFDNWSTDKAISRAKDEVLSALVEANRAEEKKISISEFMTNYKQKTVLVLGDYDEEGLQRLQVISSAIKQLGYEPILIKDIPDFPHYDLQQKVVAIGAISRFIVVDDSSKSGHLLEIGICKQNNWVTILLRARGKAGSWMTAGVSYTSNIILEKSYDLKFPKDNIIEAVTWAEDKLKELQKKFDNTYPWRISK